MDRERDVRPRRHANERARDLGRLARLGERRNLRPGGVVAVRLPRTQARFEANGQETAAQGAGRAAIVVDPHPAGRSIRSQEKEQQWHRERSSVHGLNSSSLVGVVKRPPGALDGSPPRAIPSSFMPRPEFPNLTVLDHPLIQHKLSILRDKTTTTRDFKQLVNEMAMLMAYEVTKDLPLEPVEVETPLERMRGARVAGKKLALVPILRAGLGMVEGIAQLIPSARVGHIGIYREHDTLQPVDYYFKIPEGR